MKILVLANSIIGLYKFRQELLCRFIEEGHEVVISSPNDTKLNYLEELKKKGIKHVETPINRRGMNLLKDFKLLINYLNIIKNEQPDYILTYTIKPNIYGSIAAKFLKKKKINNITGLGTSLQKENILSKLLKILYKFSLSDSYCIFFQNKDNRNFFIENKMLNLNQDIRLIPGSGVNVDKFYPMEKSIFDKQIKFLFIGRLMAEKGINEYIGCAKSIKKKYKNTEFQILGSFEEEKYKKEIQELEKEEVIKYLGISADPRQEIKEVDCVINPSWHEGMSNILLESGAMKRFLIASEIPGCKEIVINEITGLTFKVKDQKSLEEQILNYLNLSEEKKNIMISNCVEHIRLNFDRKKIIEEYLGLLTKRSK